MSDLPQLRRGDAVRIRRVPEDRWVYGDVVRHEHGIVEIAWNRPNEPIPTALPVRETVIAWLHSEGNFQVKRLDYEGEE